MKNTPETYRHYHNTTLIFNFIILSCTIWYCVPYYYDNFDTNSSSAIYGYAWLHGFGRIQYNHFLNYGNNVSNGTQGDYNLNTYANNAGRYENCYNTTLLFGNSRLLE